MDEPGTPVLGTPRPEGWSPNGGIGLLRDGDGDIRGSQWADTVLPIYSLRCY